MFVAIIPTAVALFIFVSLSWIKNWAIKGHCNKNKGKTQPAKIDLNKKWLPKQNTTQNSNIDAQGFRKTRNENPPTWK